ncbi:MAG TPA: MFS transporter [Casimicrobiaceae bacterium]
MTALRVLFLLAGAILGVFYPFVPVILSERGFDAAGVGLVTALSSLGFTLAVPVWGHVADVELGRARTLQLTVAGSTVAVLCLLLPIPALVVGALIVVYAVFESALSPLADALAVNALAASPRSYGRVRLLSSLGFAVASISAGRLYDTTGFGPASLLWAACAVVIVGVAFGVPDVGRLSLGRAPAMAARSSRRRRPGGGSFALALRVQPRLRAILLGLGLIHVGIIAGFTFLALRLLQLGGQPSDVALSSGISAIAEIPGMALAPRAVGRFGLRNVLAGAILLYVACLVSWAFLAVPALIIATRVASGIAFAGITISAVMTIGQLLPARLQGTGQALYQTVGFGVSAIAANALGGVVFALEGARPLFLGVAALGVVGAVVAWASAPARGEVVPLPPLPDEERADEEASAGLEAASTPRR